VSDSAWDKVKFTKKQKREFRKQRQALMLGAGRVPEPTTLPAMDSYGLSAGGTGGDPTDPNSYTPTPISYQTAYPAFAQPAKPLPPDAVKPLSTGKGIGTLPPDSAELKSRQAAVRDFTSSPQEFIEKNSAQLNQDETLLEKGMGVLERLFNYEDEADLEIFGVPLAPVEATWDFFNRHLTGGRNLLDIGIGGLISAMPGGVDTISYDDLSGGRSVGDVLMGDIGLEDNVGPSPMQIAIASVAIESKRIREGGARLSDLLLLNPATAPFLLAGIAAESSPLQKDDFNILDPEKRKAAFGSGGWEQFFSGVGDFGVQMAAPSIGLWAGAKAAANGMLGVSKGARFSLLHNAAVKSAYDSLARRYAQADETPVTWDERRAVDEQAVALRATRGAALRAGVTPDMNYGVPIRPEVADNFWTDLDTAGALGMDVDGAKNAYASGKKIRDLNTDEQISGLPEVDQDAVKYANRVDRMFDTWHNNRVEEAAKEAGGDVPEYVRQSKGGVRVTKSSDEAGITNPAERVINDIAQVDDAGNKVMDVDAIASRVEIRRKADTRAVANILYKLKDPYHIALALDAMAGNQQSRKALMDVLPSIYDDIYRMHADEVMKQMPLNPDKWALGKDTLIKSRRALVVQRDQLDQDIFEPKVIGMDADGNEVYSHSVKTDSFLLEQRRNIDQSIEEIDALIGFMDGRKIDLMAPGPFHQPRYAADVIADMYEQADAITLAVQRDLKYAMRTGDRDGQLILKDNWYARTINGHRERSANARYMYGKEGSGLIPRKVLRETDSTVKVEGELPHTRTRYEWEWGFVSGSEYGTGRLRRAARVWRWMGTETPSGFIGLKGTALVGSDREINAVLNVDLYENKPVLVTYMKDGILHKDVPVGGRARRDQLMKLWTDAMTDPTIDKKTVLVTIEHEMAKDFALAYGVPWGTMEGIFSRANKSRAQTLEMIRKHGMFVDPDTGKQHHVAHLKGQLANGHYMHNWEAIERHMQRKALDKFGPQAGSMTRNFGNGMEIAGDLYRNADQTFNVFWRPLVLLRLSYTQRNVFEGMVRSMAYFASLAPLVWPVQATYYGIGNAVNKRMIAKATAGVVEKATETPVFRDARAAYGNALLQYQRLNSATAPWRPDADEMRHMIENKEIDPKEFETLPSGHLRFVYGRSKDPDKGPEVKAIMTEEQYQAALAKSYERVLEARKNLEPLEDQLDQIAGNGRFGKWRRKAIDDMDRQHCEATVRLSQLQAGPVLSAGTVQAVSQAADMLEASRSLQVIERNLDTLRYDPAGSIQMFREQAGRRKAIGSGSSVVGGVRATDAFADEYEMFNRGVVSSATARRTTLSSASNASENLFRSVLIQEHVPIEWSPLKPEDWIQGMADIIETYSWNPMIRVLVENEMNVDAAVNWMLRTPEGREFLQFQRFLEGTDFETKDLTEYLPALGEKGMTTYQSRAYEKVRKIIESPDGNRGETVATRLKKMSDAELDPITGQMAVVDRIDAANTYAHMVAFEVIQQMQGLSPFMQLLSRRARAAADGSPVPVAYQDVENVLRSLTQAEYDSLGTIQGSAIVEQGTKSWMELWRAGIDKIFHVIGTIPEDSMVKFPFYNKRFKQVRNDLILNHIAAQNGGVLPRGARKGAFSKSGEYDPENLSHPEFRIKKEDLDDILYASHKQALTDVREYLYTIERRTNLGKYGEYIWPFISATQNTVTAGGRLLYRNPWVAPLITAMWTTPEKLGWRDDDGNLRMPMPLEGFNKWMEDRADIPVFGGILSGSDFITIPQNGLNVFMPDSGFMSVVPRPGAQIQWVASNAMQIGLFPPDPPDVFTKVLGEDDGAEAWGLLKDYMFGDTGSMSTRPLSYDVVLPPWIRRVIDSRDEMSEQYQRFFQLEWATQQARWRGGERDEPSNDEIHKRVTNQFWFYVLGAVGVPTPMTPYPILTRPDVQKETVTLLQESLSSYMSAQGTKDASGNYIVEPGMATMMWSRDFGDDLLPMALSGTNMNVGGAEPTDATVADTKAFDHIIRDVAPLLGENVELLDIVVNNSNGPALDYSDEAYRWQKVTRIPGLGETWRQPLAPEEIEAKRMRDAGWAEWQKFQDQLDAKMYAAGVKSTQHSGGEPFRRAQQVWIINKQKDNPHWYSDYSDGGGTRTKQTIMVLEKLASDPVFNQRMLEKGQEGLVQSINEYVFYRRHMVAALEQSGKSINDPVNAPLRESWDIIRTRLKEGDVRWAEIANRWLATDDNPQFPGDWTPDPMLQATIEGAA
jgi:hypothetical protein